MRKPSLIVRGEMFAGIKGGITQRRTWKASNIALWAMSPPEARCFIVNVVNYDYVPTPVKCITISTGDPRENIKIDSKDGQPLCTIPVGEHHQWAIDAMPSFVEIAHTLHEDRKKMEEQKTQETALLKNVRQAAAKPFASLSASLSSRWENLTYKAQKASQPQIEKWSEKARLQRAMLEEIAEDLWEKNQQRFLWLQHERFLNITAFFSRLLSGAKKIIVQFFFWLIHFLKKLPAFIVKALIHLVKTAAQKLWRTIKSPFDKFNPVRHKRFQAIIELQDGQTLKTRRDVGVSLFFINDKIMQLVFSPSELQHEEESSSELLQAFLDLLQIHYQPV